MFNNRFNSSKNDPLVEAVKQAQAEGDLRRQAIAAVNEQFGVFSRNAVVREDLAAYDAAIEEAVKCMKEGKPVLAKKDHDGDGKIESEKDEVWGSRFRAAKAAGKMEEGSAVSGEDPGMEVAKKAGAAQQAQTPSSTPARTGNAAGETLKNTAAAIREAKFNFERKQKGIRKPTEHKEADDYVKRDEKPSKKAIIAKVRAKHMKEDSSFKSAHSRGKSVYEAVTSSMISKMSSPATTTPATKPSGSFNMGNIKPDAGLRIAANSKLPPSLMSRVMRSPVVRGNPISAGASMGATASSGLGYLATQTKAGQEAGQWIRKNVPGAETAASAMRQAGEFIGVRDKAQAAAPKPTAATSTTPAATTASPTPKASTAPVTPKASVTSAPVPAPKVAAAPKSTAASTPGDASKITPTTTKSGYFKGGSMGDRTVKSGETLSGIAKSTGQSVSDLAKMNNISDVNKISAGAKLMTKVPTPPSRPADTAASTPASAPTSTASVDRSSSNPPTTSGNPTPSGGGAITQDAQKKQKTTQDAGTSSPPAPMAECVQIGANKYRIV